MIARLFFRGLLMAGRKLGLRRAAVERAGGRAREIREQQNAGEQGDNGAHHS